MARIRSTMRQSCHSCLTNLGKHTCYGKTLESGSTVTCRKFKCPASISGTFSQSKVAAEVQCNCEMWFRDALVFSRCQDDMTATSLGRIRLSRIRLGFCSSQGKKWNVYPPILLRGFVSSDFYRMFEFRGSVVVCICVLSAPVGSFVRSYIRMHVPIKTRLSE